MMRAQHMRQERGKITASLREEIFGRDDGLCQLCLEPVGKGDGVADHSIPLYHWGTTTRSNLQLAHRLCNWRKGTKLIEPGGFITLFTLAGYDWNPPVPTLRQPPPERPEFRSLSAQIPHMGRRQVQFYWQGILPDMGRNIGAQVGFGWA